jgi:adenosylcobinamide-GDP ribazoletransferase
MLESIALAFVVLTRIPVAGPKGLRRIPEASDLARATTWYPLVGATLACISTVAMAACAKLDATLSLVALIGVATSALLSGAMHLDAVADTFDSLGAGSNRERALAIMRDSSVGAFGASALSMVILAEYLGVRGILEHTAHLPNAWGAIGLSMVRAHAFGRLVGSWTLALGQPARVNDDSLASRSIRATTVVHALGSLVVYIGVSLCFDPVAVAMHTILAFAVALITTKFAQHRFGGITGDISGAIIQFAIILHLWFLH